MQTISVTLRNTGKLSDLSTLIAMLGSIGFDGFQEDDDQLTAFAVPDRFDKVDLNNVLGQEAFREIELVRIDLLPDQNWNSIWESSYQPVKIGGRCGVRAPFHPPFDEIEFDLVIEPRMSFGTAHHETTSMMIRLLLETNLKGKSLLDMGCGTAILAILASKLGAEPVIGIDNDDWAVSNAVDNIHLNNTPQIEILKGDAALLKNKFVDVFLANINRNILLNDMERYNDSINPQGKLIISGFYESDLSVLQKCATQLGLLYDRHIIDNQWVAAIFLKN